MKIAILSRKASLYSTRRLVEAARAADHQAMVVDYLRCYMNIAAHHPAVIYRGEPLQADAVVPRIGASQTFYGTAVVRQFELMGLFAVNDSQSIARSRDKLRCLQILSRKGVGLPVTGFAHSTKDVEGIMRLVGGPPVVVKLLEGTEGIGVVLCETQKAAESVIEAFRGLDANILVQEFIAEAKGSDLRAFVVGERVIASIRRQAPPGEFRTRERRGVTSAKVRLSPAERQTALAAAKALGLGVCAVDMLPSNRGPLVVAVNSSPGLEDVEKASGVDVAGAIIAYVAKHPAKPRKQSRIKG